MPLTIEQYHGYNAAQRKKVKRDELQAILDEHLNTDGNIASLRGIIRDELNTKFETMKTEISTSIKAQIKTVADENKRLSEENASIKKVLQEQQKCLERTRKEETKNNIFISGIPAILNQDLSAVADAADENAVNDHEKIIQHVLNFVYPGIEKEHYKILISFDTKENYTRHSAKIRVENTETKTKIFKGCTKFKNLEADNFLRKIFIKNDDPPLTRKENERLQQHMKELRTMEDPVEPQNRYHIKKGVLYKNGNEQVDEFNLNNQLFR